MTIKLVKFGALLTSRPAGREAYLATRAYLLTAKPRNISIDFTGVKVLTPSWADEFFTPLKKEFGKNLLLPFSNNPSVIASLKMINLL